MNKRQRKKLETKKKLRLPNVAHFPLKKWWNLFQELSGYIAEGLSIFLSKTHRVPIFLIYDGDYLEEEDDDSEEELTEEKLEEMILMESFKMQEWQNMVSKMLWSFEQIRDDYPDEPFNKWKNKWKETRTGNVLDCPQEIWDTDKLYHQKIQEGIDLFAKYFEELWD